MAITPYRPSTDLFRPLLEEFFGATGGGLLRTPAADLAETEDEIHVTVELPGMRPEDVDVDIENNVLTISGEKKEEREEKEETYHLSERRYGRFSRSFVLPRGVEQERIQARFDDGVLRVTIPKSEQTKRRRVEVRSSGGPQRVEGP